MKLRNILKEKHYKIIMASVGVNLAILALVAHQFEALSFILFAGVGFVVATASKQRKVSKALGYGIVGAAVPCIYNGMGQFLGVFDLTLTYILMSGLQQGIITFVIAKMMGVKK